MFKTLVNAFREKDIRRRIFLTLGLLIIFRIGCFIPVPGLDIDAVDKVVTSNPQGFLSLMSIMTGGALANGTLFALGILPFINSFIIMQLLTLIIPKLSEWSKGGEEDRRKLTQVTRYVAIGLAVIQAIGICVGFRDAFAPTFGSKVFTMICTIIIFTAGSTFVMWLSERITEYGIGNGTSLIIFVGIISTAGNSFITACQTMAEDPNKVWFFLGFLLLVIGLFFLIVFVDLSERRIPVMYAKRVVGNKQMGGQSTHIPMKVNAGGVMPIIFASSILMFPMMIASFWPELPSSIWWINNLGVGTPWYYVLLVPLIIFFAYFYAQIQFNPVDVAKNIQQYGGMITGIRPGRPTGEYLAKINNRLTLFGALFLGFISIIPAVGFSLLGEPIGMNNAFSATGLLIIVSVALELNKQLENQIMMKHYKGFLK